MDSQNRGDAFAVLVERHGDRFRQFFQGRVGSDTVDDALAELWETAYRRRHSFDPELGSAVGWLYGIARNVTHHVTRRRNQRRALVERMEAVSPVRRPGDDPVDRVIDIAVVEHVWNAIASLPPHERVVVETVIIRGMSYQAASDLLELPIGTIRSRLSRARDRIWPSGSGNSRC